MVAIVADGPVPLALDSASALAKGMKIINHLKAKMTTKLYDDEGRMMLGGTYSPLHRCKPEKRPYSLDKDGDIWESFQNLIQQKGPDTVMLTKVKGHATEEMV